MYNYGDSFVDLIDYYISNAPTLGELGEGYISFSESIIQP